ncbi:unnamed protein product [Cuscuta epithymum]|uniref:Uncharacterized protein n=1 Tax=Cuscuta epithymum TaxID=186058 RepID=A0AAV0EMZ2_9ASTE|nr:unnamed protein product [Cuscuta epithymum]
MSITMEHFAIGNPNSRLNRCLRQAFSARLYTPATLGLESGRLRFAHSRSCRVLGLGQSIYPKGPGVAPLRKRSLCKRSNFLFAAAHEEPISDIKGEYENDDHGKADDELQEAWRRALDLFNEQAIKMKSISKEAYDVYSTKATVILEETSEKLKIQAEKARHDLSVTAKEISEGSKEYLAIAAENSPEPVKDIMETFASSTDDLKDISNVLDFYLGIPYGALLSVGGFMLFMLTGSIPAIRFGLILGGTLLAFSISSLRSWRKGESTSLALKGQTGIAAILFLRQFRLLLQRSSIVNFLMFLISGSMAAFFAYRIIRGGEHTKGLAESQ